MTAFSNDGRGELPRIDLPAVCHPVTRYQKKAAGTFQFFHIDNAVVCALLDVASRPN